MSRSLIAVIDYGMGNLHSAAKALEHVAPDAQVEITADAERIRAADHVVFPGVGAIRDCMAEIRRLGFDAVVAEQVASGKPVLAICVGMQALMTRSEENQGVDCLDILPGQVRFFGSPLLDAAGERLKVPHMGWNQVQQTVAHPLWHRIDNGERFYFVHSYYVAPGAEDITVGEAGYGEVFAASLARGNLFAAQFHPEKSHTAGLQLLKNFVQWNGQP